MARHTVLQLIHTTDPGGSETLVQELVERLYGKGWRCIVALPADGWLHSALVGSPADVVALSHGARLDAKFVYRLVRLVRGSGVDLIHTHHFGPALYGGSVGRLVGVPVVSTIHGTVDLAWAHRWWNLKLHLLQGPRHRFVAVTEEVRRAVIEDLQVSAERVQVVRNGIDSERFVSAPDRSFRAELGWNSGDLVVGAVGHVRGPKSYETLIDAASILRFRCPECRFVIVGDTTEEPELYRALLVRRRDLKLENRVVFAGFRNDIPRVLNNFDVFVSSSSREGLPLAVLQAMATSLPVVSTRSGGPQEVLTDGRNGVLVPTRDPAALAHAIERLAKDAALRAGLGAAARATVVREYTRERMVRDYERLYLESVARGRRSDAGGRPRSAPGVEPRALVS